MVNKALRKSALLGTALLAGWLVLAPANRCDHALLLGDDFFLAADAPKAYEHYSQALSIDPRSWRARVRLGRLLARSGKMEQADEYYRSALAIAPREPEVLEDAATFYLSRQDYSTALPLLRTIISERPANFEALFLLAELEHKQGRPGPAEMWLNKILEHNPDHYEAFWQLALVQKDVDAAKAMETIQKMLRSGPPDRRRAKALLLLGQLQMGANQDKEGRASLEAVIEEHPYTQEAQEAETFLKARE